MPWSQVEIVGKTADVFVPDAAEPRGAVIHLHGHGLTTPANNPVWTAEFERHGLRCICPHGQRSWWLDVLCWEFDAQLTSYCLVVEHVVPWIAENCGVEPPGIGLTGISMGGQGVLQLAYRRAREFPVVAAIAPAVDFHEWYGRGLPLDAMFPDRESARQQTAILHVHPLDWPKHQLLVCDPADEEWFESLERLTSKLSSSGIPFESDTTTSAGGHSWDYFDTMAPRAIAFVAERLPR